jgi:uncharacterized membrane-anchored protein
MKKPFFIGVFVLALIAQWYFPSRMIGQKERIVQQGVTYRFECEPIDPRDPFRGQYLILSFKEDTWRCAACDNDTIPAYGYVLLTTGADGYAKVDTLLWEPPAAGDYVQVELSPVWLTERKIRIQYRFDRFYLNEQIAQKAEQAYFEAVNDSTGSAYALVSVLEGETVLQDVVVNGKSVKEAGRE